MKNMRKLNKKGFTLVELLAVVVILALVMGIAATSMLNTMNSSRKNTLHSAAQTAATNLNNWVADDMLETDSTKLKLGTTFIEKTQTGTNAGKWICLNSSDLTLNNSVSILGALGLSDKDLVTSGTAPDDSVYKTATANTKGNFELTENLCSALRYNTITGGYEFFFKATSSGKYYVAGDGAKLNYAFSRASKSNETIKD